jgi:hypothetical protein
LRCFIDGNRQRQRFAGGARNFRGMPDCKLDPDTDAVVRSRTEDSHCPDRYFRWWFSAIAVVVGCAEVP